MATKRGKECDSALDNEIKNTAAAAAPAINADTTCNLNKACASSEGGSVADPRIGKCVPVLIKEYGVIHLRGALSERGQRDLWQLLKPRIQDPRQKATGFSGFSISKKGGKSKRVPAFDEYGALMFGLCADRLTHTLRVDECAEEPSYKRLHDLVSGTQKLNLEEIQGNYYRADASLMNHTDGDGILLTMSVALGDDCDFVIGQKTNRC